MDFCAIVLNLHLFLLNFSLTLVACWCSEHCVPVSFSRWRFYSACFTCWLKKIQLSTIGSTFFVRSFHFAKQKAWWQETHQPPNKDSLLLHAGNGTIFDSLQSNKDFLPHWHLSLGETERNPEPRSAKGRIKMNMSIIVLMAANLRSVREHSCVRSLWWSQPAANAICIMEK